MQSLARRIGLLALVCILASVGRVTTAGSGMYISLSVRNDSHRCPALLHSGSVGLRVQAHGASQVDDSKAVLYVDQRIAGQLCPDGKIIGDTDHCTDLKFFEQDDFIDFEVLLKGSSMLWRSVTVVFESQSGGEIQAISTVPACKPSHGYTNRHLPAQGGDFAIGQHSDVDRCNASAIIFSKDRPPQLDLLLRSMQKYVIGLPPSCIHVIHMSSVPGFMDGYNIVARDHPDVHMAQQNTTSEFKTLLISTINEHVLSPYCLFLVDDIVITREWDLTAEGLTLSTMENAHSLVAMSPRLHRGIQSCYASNSVIHSPTLLHEDPAIWEWAAAEGDFSYPMSVDGHVFRTHDVASAVGGLDYSNPNEFEAGMAHSPFIQPHLGAVNWHKATLFNNPSNRVQQQFPNRFSGSSCTGQLNEEFLMGRRLSLEYYSEVDTISVHHELPLLSIVGRTEDHERGASEEEDAHLGRLYK